MELLLSELGCDASMRSARDGAMPVHLAAARGSRRGLPLLLSRGASATQRALGAVRRRILELVLESGSRDESRETLETIYIRLCSYEKKNTGDVLECV